MRVDAITESEVEHISKSDNEANETAEFGKIERDSIPNLEKERPSSNKNKD